VWGGGREGGGVGFYFDIYGIKTHFVFFEGEWRKSQLGKNIH